MPSFCVTGVNVFAMESPAHWAAFATVMVNTRDPSAATRVSDTRPGSESMGGFANDPIHRPTMRRLS